jgi:hypothetical protein
MIQFSQEIIDDVGNESRTTKTASILAESPFLKLKIAQYVKSFLH